MNRSKPIVDNLIKSAIGRVLVPMRIIAVRARSEINVLAAPEE